MKPVFEFISTGSELMSGTTTDTNFVWAAGTLVTRGIVPCYHSSVGDDLEDIIGVLSVASGRSDIVVISGGLGPTEDDMTARAASEFFNAALVFNEEQFGIIEHKLAARGRKSLPLHRKLAFFPEGSEIIPNEKGIAPGFFRCSNGKLFYFLPGVPSEFRAMFSGFVIPDLVKRLGTGGSLSFRTIKTIGLGESEVSSRLSGLNLDGVSLSYRICFPEIHICLLSYGSSKTSAERKTLTVEKSVKEMLGEFVFSCGEGSLEDTVAELLRRNGLTISTAESCTGGLLASRLTDVPGSSAYFTRGVVTYSNSSKTDTLGVPAELIEKYGAVSGEVVESMASGIRRIAGTDIGIGISGIAGPSGGTDQKPVGTVFIGVDTYNTGSFSEKFLFYGSRKEVKLITTSYALNIIRNIITNIV